MGALLVVVIIYTIIYGVDYLLFIQRKHVYEYVSRRTWSLFIFGQILVFGIFYSYFKPYLINFQTESLALGILFGILLLFSYLVSKNKLFLCNTASRTERCLSPAYVCVKGADIFFQQLCYIVIALAIKDMFGSTVSAYVLFALVMLLIHLVLAFSMHKQWVLLFGFGSLVLSAPLFYTYTAIGQIWPAIYIHSLAYIFIWIGFADMEGITVENCGKVS